MNAPDLGFRVNSDWATLPLLDRSKWQRVRFGDVVENLNETCDPNQAEIERYIGLEHLEPGSLHIRSWGNVADGTTFTRRAGPGQILFGKRRAYQRKVAVASFDAVVSGDIYVFAPKGDRLLSDLLPFLCMSDRFFDHAVGTSAGSLSPRTNWSSLASFEFALPPLRQQQRCFRSVRKPGTQRWRRRESQTSAGMIFGIPGRAGTCSKARLYSPCRSWAGGRARRWCGGTHTFRLNISPRTRIAYALCGSLTAQIRHRRRNDKGLHVCKPLF